MTEERMSIMGVWLDARRLPPDVFRDKYIVSLDEEMTRDLTSDERQWLADRARDARAQSWSAGDVLELVDVLCENARLRHAVEQAERRVAVGEHLYATAQSDLSATAARMREAERERERYMADAVEAEARVRAVETERDEAERRWRETVDILGQTGATLEQAEQTVAALQATVTGLKDVVATHERTLGVLNRCPQRRACETCDYHLYDSLGQQRPKPDPACVAEVERLKAEQTGSALAKMMQALSARAIAAEAEVERLKGEMDHCISAEADVLEAASAWLERATAAEQQADGWKRAYDRALEQAQEAEAARDAAQLEANVKDAAGLNATEKWQQAEHTVAVLRTALDKYARHRYDCGSRPGDACTCGLDALLTRY